MGGVLQAATITDYPRFKYRGILLDDARHFFTVNEIEKLIDLMAAHKLNTLHMHFNDDEDFRLGFITQTGSTRSYGQLLGPMLFEQGNLDITNYDNVVYPYADTAYSNNLSELAFIIAVIRMAFSWKPHRAPCVTRSARRIVIN